jgi:uncharacterized repeat protein (TIGR04076 family)
MNPCKPTSFYKEVVGDPGKCGCSFIKSKKLFYPLKAVPQGFCPALFHASIPYFVTLLNNGWMRWVKKMSDPNMRRDIPSDASKIINMNRLFCNEVIVQCPATKNRVVTGIGPAQGDRKKIIIRVLDVMGNCPLSIKVNDIFEYNADKEKFCLEAFYRIYPYLLLADSSGGFPFQGIDGTMAMRCSCNTGEVTILPQANDINKDNGGKPDAGGMKLCGDYKHLTVSVNKLENKCRYHDSYVSYYHNNFAPPGLCPDIFHVAYPFALALLYDADFSGREKKDSVTVSCPNNKGIKLMIKREERHFRLTLKFIKVLEKVFEKFFYPVDKIYNDISLTVVSTGGECPRKHQLNEKYYLNIRDKNVMCPATFSSLFPHLVLSSYGGATDRLIHCPDCQGAEYVVNIKEEQN